MSDLAIERVHTAILDIPLRRPHRFARTGMEAQPILLVTVTTRGRVSGVGEGVVPGGPWWGGESVETMQVIIERYLTPVLLGRRVDDIAGIQQAMNDVVNSNLYAKAAVEVALHDAWARSLDVPVHTLLGGLARTSVPVTWALGTESAAEVIEEARGKLEAGLHTSFKLKMGAQEPADDVARVAEVAQKLTDDASVRVDINARWDLMTSLRWLPRLAEAGVDLIEQPVPGAEVEWMAEINAALPVPVMADESLRTPSDALRLVKLRAADVFSLKISKSGGLRYTRAIADVAAAAGVPCHGGTAIDGPIGTAATLHLACAMPGVTYGTELFGPLLMREELLTEPLRYTDGQLHLPDGPGLGVELDPSAVALFTRG
jgi:muconate cycloisomerase